MRLARYPRRHDSAAVVIIVQIPHHDFIILVMGSSKELKRNISIWIKTVWISYFHSNWVGSLNDRSRHFDELVRVSFNAVIDPYSSENSELITPWVYQHGDQMSHQSNQYLAQQPAGAACNIRIFIHDQHLLRIKPDRLRNKQDLIRWSD